MGLLTGSDWANSDSRRFPRPVRVLLAITYSLLTVTILAYTSLVRSSSGIADLDAYAELGDLVLGTALLAAARVHRGVADGPQRAPRCVNDLAW